MRDIMIDKITLNIGVGEPGNDLDKAFKLLSKISGSKPVQTKSKKRIPTWKIRPGLPIGTKVTLRKNKANEVLKRLFVAARNEIPAKKFDKNGNFSFGINEYLDVPGIEYDAEIGIIGFEVAVTLKRPGFRVKSRLIGKGKIPKKHLISKEESIEFIKKNFGVEVK